jgi:hypothetical protein
LKSVATNHFPRYTFKDGEKLLWNPLLKKAFSDRPEERVRLQLLDFLLLEASYSSSRISFESPVNLPRDKSASRTDVICFDKNFDPYLLIECKAPEVTLNEKASIQIARYNQKVGAPFLLISNGLEDFLFSNAAESIMRLSEFPLELSAKSEFNTDWEYWEKRGFIGKRSDKNIKKWILESCDMLYQFETNSAPSYFKFPGTDPTLFLANYYRIFMLNRSDKLALSLTATPFGTTLLNGVLNRNGVNTSIISISCDLLADKDSKNTLIHSSSGASLMDLNDQVSFSFSNSLDHYINDLASLMS